MRSSIFAASTFLMLVACDTGSKTTTPPAATKEPPAATPSAPEGALRLGAPIETSAQKVALADIARTPNNWVGKTFTTTGTVTAVCQHAGCWMEIKDDASAAHIKMAGHAFFVPKTASGRKARVQAKLVKAEETGSCEGDGQEGMAAAGGAATGGGAAGATAAGGAAKHGCRAEAEAKLGRPLAKLELVADGVELM